MDWAQVQATIRFRKRSIEAEIFLPVYFKNFVWRIARQIIKDQGALSVLHQPAVVNHWYIKSFSTSSTSQTIVSIIRSSTSRMSYGSRSP